MKKLSFFTIIGAFALALMVGVPHAHAALYPKPACALTAGPGDVLINFSGKRLRADEGAPQAIDYTKVSIPAGKYDVYLHAFDGYDGRSGVSQPHEQYHVIVNYTSGGSKTTGTSGDVPDYKNSAYWVGKVSSNFVVAKNANSVWTRNAAYKSTNPNSVMPVCALFKKVKPPVNGQCNASLNGKYLSVKPTSGLCTRGTASAVSGAGTETSPWRWSCGGSNGGTTAQCSAKKHYVTAGISTALSCQGNHSVESIMVTARRTGGSTTGAVTYRYSCDGGANWTGYTTAHTHMCHYTTTGSKTVKAQLKQANITSSQVSTSVNVGACYGDPAIKIDKNDADNHDDTQTVEKDETATFTITVTNTGKVDLKNVVVTDPKEPACNNTLVGVNGGVLKIGESKSYTCTSKNVQESFTNTANVEGSSVEDNKKVSDSDPTKVVVHMPLCGNGTQEDGEQCDDGNTKDGDGCSAQCTIENASIKIDKNDADNGDDQQLVELGHAATFTIKVTNAGKEDLKDVTVTDVRVPSCDKNIGDLAAGASKTYTCQDSSVEGGYTNTAKVTGDPVSGGSTVSDSDTSVVTTQHTPQGPICGNGIVEAGEECDGGSDCTSSCKKEDHKKTCKASIGDTIYNDRNKNGHQDDGEEGMSGVRVKLYDGNDIDYDTTDSNGLYKFKNLCAGKYKVIVASETVDEGCYLTGDPDGTLDGKKTVRLTKKEKVRDVDFGYYCPGTTVHRTSPATGAGAATTGVATLLASGAAYINYRRMRKRAGSVIEV